ncbi:Zinc finger BED domain-containing protein 1 [Folsomia candida]|uniref:Zinc finger BED domain-containing protein 1 n=1 Tax=Folsomia candida TaxID=158441 RepID=A0A226CWM0_FOLCA|nr:Zinc finger BED domain-containing protein 1 [Folsomia candida]
MSNASEFDSSDVQRIYPVILDGTFFVVKSVENNGKRISAQCNLCSTNTLITGSLAATGNFVVHLKRKHPETIEDYESRKKVQIPAIKKKKHDENERIANARCGQSTLTNIVFTKEVVKKQSRTTKLDQLVLNFIVKGMHPLSTIEQPAFQQLVKGLNPAAKLVSRRMLGRQTNDEFLAAKSKLIARIQQVKYCCITKDAWTCKGMSRGFLGVTIHWSSSSSKIYENQQLSKESDDFFAFSSSANVAQGLHNIENKIRLQTCQYLDNEDEGLAMLQKYSSVMGLFIKYNTTLPSSGPAEQMFNYAGMILSPKRRIMSDSLFEMLIVKDGFVES